MKSNYFQSKEIKKMSKVAGGNTYTIIYLKMQLASLQNGGKLYYDGLEDSFAKEIALDLDESPENVKETLVILEKEGLIYYPDKHSMVVKRITSKRNRNSHEYREWKKAVFERDNYTCRKCGKRGGILNAHHIKSWAYYPNFRFSVDNGITLCERCHKQVHRKGNFK